MKMKSSLSLLLFLFILLGDVECVDPVLNPLSNYVAQGAVCLDGSTPGYYYRPGVGNGSNHYLIHHEGGGWCYTVSDCYSRSLSSLGSSLSWPTTLDINNALCCSTGGILSDDPALNPNFWDWNLVWIGYCDGSSFSGNADEPAVYNNSKIYYRGSRILESTITDLLENKGLANAQSVIVTGCSAGGLSTYLHLDRYRARIPSSIPVHGLADAGFFMYYVDYQGDTLYANEMKGAFEMWNSSGEVNQDCINSYSAEDQWHCIMAQFTYPHITTPIFILNSKYDSWQLENVLNIQCVPWNGTPTNCNAQELQALLSFGNTTQSTIVSLYNGTKDGIWLTGCIQHCLSIIGTEPAVQPWVNFTIDNISPQQAFYEWYTTGKGAYIDSPPYGQGAPCPG